MIQATCIQKHRDDNGRIVTYELQDSQGNTTYMDPARLKYMIWYGEIQVNNLKLTMDNRLIDKKPEESATDRIIKRDISLELDNLRGHIIANALKASKIEAGVSISNIIDSNGTQKRYPTVRLYFDDTAQGKVLLGTVHNGIRDVFGCEWSRYVPHNTKYLDFILQTDLITNTETKKSLVDCTITIKPKTVTDTNIELSPELESINKHLNQVLDNMENMVTHNMEIPTGREMKEVLEELAAIYYKSIAKLIYELVNADGVDKLVEDELTEANPEQFKTNHITELREHSIRGNAPTNMDTVTYRRQSQNNKQNGLIGLFNRFSRK